MTAADRAPSPTRRELQARAPAITRRTAAAALTPTHREAQPPRPALTHREGGATGRCA